MKNKIYTEFSLQGLGVDRKSLMSHLKPHIKELPWDSTEKDRGLVEKETRKRGVALIDAVRTSIGWILNRVPMRPYVQKESYGDYDRTTPRVFHELDASATEHPEFKKLLKNVIGMLNEVRTDLDRVQIQVFLQRIVHDEKEGRMGICAFEGSAHKDGVDGLVPALVLGRFNCKEDSGKSITYDNDMNPLGEVVLGMGEGTFVHDPETYHDITHIEPENPELPAYRDMLGFDVLAIDTNYRKPKDEPGMFN